MDINLEDQTGDDEYLELLGKAVRRGARGIQRGPDFLRGRRRPLPRGSAWRLWLSIGGLRRRDEMVFGEAKRRGIPVAVALAGGYARDTADTVRIHMNTVVAGRDVSDGAARRGLGSRSRQKQNGKSRSLTAGPDKVRGRVDDNGC